MIKPILVSNVKETKPVVLLNNQIIIMNKQLGKEGGGAIFLFVNKLQLHGWKHAVALPALMFYCRKQGWIFVTIGPFILVQNK